MLLILAALPQIPTILPDNGSGLLVSGLLAVIGLYLILRR